MDRRATIYWSTHNQQEYNKTERSSYGVDWLWKGLWHSLPKLDNTLSQNVQDIQQSHQENHENLESENDSRRKKLYWGKDPERLGDELSLLLFVIAIMPLNHIIRKYTGRYKISKLQEKINHLIYMDDIKLFAKNEKELKTLIQAVRIYSQNIGMEFGIEKCTTLIMKSGK